MRSTRPTRSTGSSPRSMRRRTLLCSTAGCSAHSHREVTATAHDGRWRASGVGGRLGQRGRAGGLRHLPRRRGRARVRRDGRGPGRALPHRLGRIRSLAVRAGRAGVGAAGYPGRGVPPVRRSHVARQRGALHAIVEQRLTLPDDHELRATPGLRSPSTRGEGGASTRPTVPPRWMPSSRWPWRSMPRPTHPSRCACSGGCDAATLPRVPAHDPAWLVLPAVRHPLRLPMAAGAGSGASRRSRVRGLWCRR
jgi:hypothetical protein